MPEAPLAPPTRPSRPAPAASLVVLRAEAGGMSVLMGQRSARHRFMPRALVFPGGRLDRCDRAAARQADGRRAGSDPLAAFVACAFRETAEETGLVAAPGTGAAHLCRLVTPSFLPIRFDARFLVAAAEAFSGRLGGSGELEFLRWVGLDEAAGLELSQPTRVVLDELAAWLAAGEAGRAAHVAPCWRHRAGWLRRDPPCPVPGQLAARKLSLPA